MRPHERLRKARERLRWTMALGEVVTDVQELPEPEVGDFQAARPRPARSEAEEEEIRAMIDAPEDERHGELAAEDEA